MRIYGKSFKLDYFFGNDAYLFLNQRVCKHSEFEQINYICEL